MPDDTKTFTFEEDGVSFIVTVNRDGTATIEVTEGSADFNAIYWDDGGDGGAGLDGPLNMNGEGSRDDDGNAIDWDGAAALSMPGLGNDGPSQLDDVFDDEGNKATYLEAGQTLDIEIDWGEDFDFDNLTNIGVRATSVGGDEGGSIKAVSGEDPEVPDDQPEEEYDKLWFYFENDDFDKDSLAPYKTYIVEKSDGSNFSEQDKLDVLEDLKLIGGYDDDAFAGIRTRNASDEEDTEYFPEDGVDEDHLKDSNYNWVHLHWDADADADANPFTGGPIGAESGSDSSGIPMVQVSDEDDHDAMSEEVEDDLEFAI